MVCGKPLKRPVQCSWFFPFTAQEKPVLISPKHKHVTCNYGTHTVKLTYKSSLALGAL
jgi:hypothetical protein